jgi:pimeloyl-ACP methyl ester carboxylesterase
MEQVRVGDRVLACRRAGSGTPLVLLHGYAGDSGDWEPLLRELATELTVVAWDAPGFGGSSDPPDDPTSRAAPTLSRSSSPPLLPGVGHMVHLEAPERFNAEVRAFVRPVPA